MVLTVLIILTWVFIGLTAYTYVGYPVLLAVLQRFFTDKIDSAPIEPMVSMVIPTFNEEDVIRRKIENSLSLDYPREKLEILIIDDDSDDATQAIIEAYAEQGVTLIRKPQRSGKMESLQIGVQQAQGDIIVMSDASPSYSEDAIRQLVQHFNDPTIGIVVGTLAVWDAENAVAKPAGLYWRYEAAIRRWESRLGSTVAMHGNLYAIRKPLFPKLAKSTINDEWSITMRTVQAGYRVVYEPDAISYDDVSKKMDDEFRRRVRINAGRYQAFFGTQNLWPWNAPMVIFEIISHKFLRLILPFLMGGALIFNILTVLLPDAPLYMGILLVLQLTFYGLALVGRLFETGKGYLRIANLAYYLTSSNIAAFFGFLRFMRNSQKVTWEKVEREVGG